MSGTACISRNLSSNSSSKAWQAATPLGSSVTRSTAALHFDAPSLTASLVPPFCTVGGARA